jgi:hypothetical protein
MSEPYALQATTLLMLESLSYTQELRWWLESFPSFPGLFSYLLPENVTEFVLLMVETIFINGAEEWKGKERTWENS